MRDPKHRKRKPRANLSRARTCPALWGRRGAGLGRGRAPIHERLKPRLQGRLLPARGDPPLPCPVSSAPPVLGPGGRPALSPQPRSGRGPPRCPRFVPSGPPALSPRPCRGGALWPVPRPSRARRCRGDGLSRACERRAPRGRAGADPRLGAAGRACTTKAAGDASRAGSAGRQVRAAGGSLAAASPAERFPTALLWGESDRGASSFFSPGPGPAAPCGRGAATKANGCVAGRAAGPLVEGYVIYLGAGSRSPVQRGPSGPTGNSAPSVGTGAGDTRASQALAHLLRLTPARCRGPACARTPHSLLLAPAAGAPLARHGTERSALPGSRSGRARPLLSAPETAPARTESFADGGQSLGGAWGLFVQCKVGYFVLVRC